MSKSAHCVVIGASHGGVQAATRLRRLGWEGDITLLGEEAALPYHRPPLSKDYLKGAKSRDGIVLHTESAYKKAGVMLRRGCRAEAIDREAREVLLADGSRHSWDKLVLATGSRPRELRVSGAALGNVFCLRNVEDVDAIRAATKEGAPAVVIGGGYIGLEAAASLRLLGMEVTVVEAMDRVLQRVTSEPVSTFYTRVHGEEGVIIRTAAKVAALDGDERVEAVELEGGERLPAELVVVGIGILPNTGLAEAAELAVEDGILVNEFAQTSDPDIYAIGDCARFDHPRYGNVRLESVQNANDQAVIAAKSICGKPEPYAALPWFWSDQYGTKLQIAGLAAGAEKIVLRGDPADGRNLSVLYVSGGRLQAVDAINRPRDFVFGKRLIISGDAIDTAKLVDPDIPLMETILDADAPAAAG